MEPTGLHVPRFIVGMPRAGTTWLCQSLNQHPDVAAFGESMFWGRSYVSPGLGRRYSDLALRRVKDRILAKPFETTTAIPGPGAMKSFGADQVSQVLGKGFDRLDRRPTPPDTFLRLADEIARAEGKSAWVEKTPHHVLYAGRILKWLPTARFLVMIREPYSFMLSYKHQPGHQRTAESRRRFQRRYHPLACALVWRNTWRAAQALVRSHPEQALIVRMEDIEADASEVLSRAQSFFMLNEHRTRRGLSEKINSSFGEGPKPGLSDSDIAWMNLIAGREIRESGYRLRRGVQAGDRKGLWRSVLDLPAWSIRFAQDAVSTRMAREQRGPSSG